jgi:hypothetical protein
VAVRTLALVLLVIVVASAVGRDPGAMSGQEGVTSSTVARFGDGEWNLRVNRTFDYRPGIDRIPSDTPIEADFRPLSGGPTYRVVVSDRGSRVSIHGVFGENPVEGHHAGAIDGRTEYDLGVGYGGRVVVWPARVGYKRR